MILTCVRKHAPIASQARHFPPCSGKADTKEERNYSFLLFKYAFCDYPMPDSSLRVILYSFLLLIFSSACRSRMTAEVKCVLQMKLNGSCHKRKE